MTVARLTVRNLGKSYAAPVLKDVHLTIEKGEVHAIVGENGAGKTTLVNILAGLVRRDGGEILLDGKPYEASSARDAFSSGISVAAQELATIDTLSVAENIALRQLPARRGVIDRTPLRKLAQDAMSIVGLEEAKADTAVGMLSIADRQLVELARALSGDARLLILDEPTAALTSVQADRLHKLIRERAASGVAVIYISHRLADVLDVADKVSVLRDGNVVLSHAAASIDVDDLVAAMAGDIFRQHGEHDQAGESGEALIRAESITTDELPTPISLTGHAGEIVGLFGLAGAGRSELLHAIFGLDRRTRGKVVRGGVETKSASQAVANGIALLGEDRQSMGLYHGLSVRTNMMIPGKPLDARAYRLIDRHGESASASKLIDKLNIRCRGTEQNIDELSGGNQQKALIARWLHCDCDVLLLDEPTRGVDVATKSAIYDLLFELRNSGKCIVLASSEIEELMTVSSRILVLSGRKLVREFARGAWSETEILAAAFDAHTKQAALH